MKSTTLAIAASAAVFPIAMSAVALPVLVAGCSADVDEPVGVEADNRGAPLTPPDASQLAAKQADPGGETQKVCEIGRDDLVANPTVHEGNWGAWGCNDYCAPGSYVHGVELRAEPNQFGGDDTAVNGIRGHCFNEKSGQFTGTITSSVGPWGSWRGLGTPSRWCGTTGLPIATLRLKVEKKLTGDGDDTSANSLMFACLGSPQNEVEVLHFTDWGSWGAQSFCPGGSAICGFQTRVEAKLPSGDDTALNGLKALCCKL